MSIDKILKGKDYKTDIMKKPSIATIIIIIGILIISLYVMGEVNYFSSKVIVERNIESPTVLIPKIGVNEKINNETLSQGVLHEPESYLPTKGDVLLFGHRTLQGSPFLRLNEVSEGDVLLLEWPGIGELSYTVTNKTIVPDTYQLDAIEGEDNLYLITCDPIGSTQNRLIVQGELQSTHPINNTIVKENPKESYALIISVLFLIIGIGFSLLIPKDNRIYIIITILIISAVLFYCCYNPIPSQYIYDKIIFLNGGI